MTETTGSSGYPWRYRCPEGHANIELGASVFSCDSCGTTYPKDQLVDLASA